MKRLGGSSARSLASTGEYIQVICDRSPANVAPSPAINPTNLQNSGRSAPLEMQRRLLMMHQLWLVLKNSRPEGTQILHAARALNWLGCVGVQLKGFQTPAQAPSNIDHLNTVQKSTGSWWRQPKLASSAQHSTLSRCLDTVRSQKSERRRNSSFCFIRHP